MSTGIQPDAGSRIEPGFEFVYAASGELARTVEIGHTPLGESRVVPILSGPVEGPRISGQLYARGFDWQSTRPDGVTVIDAQYGLETSGGVIIQVRTRGLRRPQARQHSPARMMGARATSAACPSSSLPPGGTHG